MRSKVEKILTAKAGKIYKSVLEGLTYDNPHSFIERGYGEYLKKHGSPKTGSLNGKVFEFFICETLAQEGILPFYYQAKFVQVPNAEFDITFYHPDSPVVLSAKASLRERWKQADVEGRALRQVYSSAETYLITHHKTEQRSVQTKIRKGGVWGLESCIRADTPSYDVLLEELAERDFVEPEMVMPISGALVSGK